MASNSDINPIADYVPLSRNRLWLDAFYFVIDELDSDDALNRFLLDILTEAGRTQILIAANAIGTKPKDCVSAEVQRTYEKPN